MFINSILIKYDVPKQWNTQTLIMTHTYLHSDSKIRLHLLVREKSKLLNCVGLSPFSLKI